MHFRPPIFYGNIGAPPTFMGTFPMLPFFGGDMLVIVMYCGIRGGSGGCFGTYEWLVNLNSSTKIGWVKIWKYQSTAFKGPNSRWSWDISRTKGENEKQWNSAMKRCCFFLLLFSWVLEISKDQRLFGRLKALGDRFEGPWLNSNPQFIPLQSQPQWERFCPNFCRL